MTLTLELSDGLEERLQQAAADSGMSPQELALRVLDQSLPHDAEAKRRRAIELLRQWREEGDEEEQRETWEALKKGLDENRTSYRKLFP